MIQRLKPFPDGPQWRIIGRWSNGRTFFVCRGSTERECHDSLSAGLEEYSDADMARIEWLSLERMIVLTSGSIDWEPVKDVPLQAWRIARVKAARKSLRIPEPV